MQNIFRIPSFTICFFNFLVFLISFFFLFYLSKIWKKMLNFWVLLLFGSKILSKNSAKLWFFFQKKLRYLKSKFSTKFHRLLFLFYFFCIFGILFSISPMQTCLKTREFFVVLYWRVRVFTNDFWKFLCFFILWIRDFSIEFWKIMEYFS